MNDDRATQLERRIDGEAAEAEPAPLEIEALVSLASGLRLRLSPAAPSAPQRARIWAMVEAQLHADSSPSQVRRPRPVLRPAYALAAIGLAVLLMSGTTAAYASEGALPGDVLYPLKRGLESARLALSLTPDGEEDLIAVLADRRLAEIEGLSALGRWDDVEAALETYAQAVNRLEEIGALEAETHLTHHLEVLERVRSAAPDSAQPGLMRALERASRGKDEAADRRHKDETPNEAPGREAPDAESDGGPDGKSDRNRGRPGGMPPGLEKKLTPTP